MTRAEFAARHGLDAEPADRGAAAGQPPERNRAEFSGAFVEACERLARAMKRAAAVQFVHAAAPADRRAFCAMQRRRRRSRSSASKARPTTRWPRRIAPSWPAGRPPSKPRCWERRWSSIYRVAPLTALILRRMIRTPFIGMVNLIAGRARGPGVDSGRFHARRRRSRGSPPARIARGREEMKAGLAEVRAKLGPGRRDRAGRGYFRRNAVVSLRVSARATGG